MRHDITDFMIDDNIKTVINILLFAKHEKLYVNWQFKYQYIITDI